MAGLNFDYLGIGKKRRAGSDQVVFASGEHVQEEGRFLGGRSKWTIWQIVLRAAVKSQCRIDLWMKKQDHKKLFFYLG